ncbi:hypothetical protein FKW77_002023 [Venturia effusa]|uniref:WSC domain-containing protein n=1 Tax=Venturia effusa TaxID=50376 RepID=A0A517L2V2_9PEZI|nr:hypothetical protein FKW77_002023 [Venturia effusa]
MKFLNLLPAITLLPTSAYAWDTGSKCCESDYAWFHSLGYLGCAVVHGTPRRLLENKDTKCAYKCHTEAHFPQIHVYSYATKFNGPKLCLCTGFKADDTKPCRYNGGGGGGGGEHGDPGGPGGHGGHGGPGRF